VIPEFSNSYEDEDFMTRSVSYVSLVLGLAASLFVLVAVGKADEKHVDCDKIMRELVNGKSAQEVAADMDISASTVYDCENAKAATARQSVPSAAPTAYPPAAH
jgi:hypothetical protein